MIKYFIFSKNRLDNQATLERIPGFIRKQTTLVVYPDEYEQYNSTWGDVVEVISSPSGVNGLPARRDWVFNEFGGKDIIFQLDDDLNLSVAKEQELSPFISGLAFKKTPTDVVVEAWRKLEDFINESSNNGFYAGSLYPRVAPIPFYSYPAAMNRRLMSAWWIDTAQIDVSTIDFTSVTYAEDFYVSCQLFERGFATVQTSIITLDNFKTGNPGGLSGIRFAEGHNRSMELLHKFYPEATKLTYKEGALGDNVAKISLNSKKLFAGDLAEASERFDNLYYNTIGFHVYERKQTHKLRAAARKAKL